jgi:hypothetical protein
MGGTVSECLQSERIYSCFRRCGHNVEGGGRDVDQKSFNSLSLLFSETSQKRSLFDIMMLVPGAER